ncbi:hypothetical protein AWB81_08326 [Caballeronia arationis]|uniref:hypothetical protein n=1 Tax=Caballeronia arationis TaxID=1777142 RepID=UPI00074CB481|nr:hypothetical protein [Caballeronia arationis]SAL07826.1 hypothetical protein AWB81_08326 [Caballeronia arationis]
MTRQNSAPLLLEPDSDTAVRLDPLNKSSGYGDVSEADIQHYVQAHPSCLPITEIDPIFAGPVPICTELNTPAGAIDNFMVTPSGLPVLVECKLWRNPEARREVVGQILDYAKELSRWSAADLQRAVRQRLNRKGDPLLESVRAVDPTVEESLFNDALTLNLRRGRFLLLIVGDGIREGVEALVEYLQAHAGLHFTLGLVEMPIYLMPGGGRLIVPRVLARTAVITRTVVAVPEGLALEDGHDNDGDESIDKDRLALTDEQQKFWKAFLDVLKLDDPEQPIPKPARQGYLGFMLPAPSGSSWLTVYRDLRQNEVGVFLSSHRNTAGERAMFAIADDWDDVKQQLGGSAVLVEKDGRPRIIECRPFAPLTQLQVRQVAFQWLAERVNAFVNVLRPRVRSAVGDGLPVD